MAKGKKKCPSCEAEFPGDCAYCPGCGAKMEEGGARSDDEGLGKLLRKAVSDELDERGIGKKEPKDKAKSARIFDW